MNGKKVTRMLAALTSMCLLFGDIASVYAEGTDVPRGTDTLKNGRQTKL